MRAWAQRRGGVVEQFSPFLFLRGRNLSLLSLVHYYCVIFNVFFVVLLFLVKYTLLPSPTKCAGAVCSNGLEGVESTSLDVCCVEACGMCGGVGCAQAGGNGSTLTEADCCATEIVDSGVLCVDTGAAPCIITTREFLLRLSHESAIFVCWCVW